MRTSRGTPPPGSVRDAVVPVRTPYRLDLTAAVLRRLSTNVVDVFADGVYRRLLDPSGATLFEVRQHAADALAVRLTGPDAELLDPVALVRRILGADRTVAAFERGAERLGWLAPYARAARGVKPPRYPSLWETVCNAIVYQQVSIHAAGAILRRVVEHFGRPLEAEGVRLVPFFGPEAIAGADPQDLRRLGLSINKITALTNVAHALLAGDLVEAELEPLPTPDLLASLVRHRGIGPWTAAVIALRGFGRLDVFPLNDSGAEKTLRALSGDPAIDLHAVLDALAPEQGMLYYHLLLSRLDRTGEVVLAR